MSVCIEETTFGTLQSPHECAQLAQSAGAAWIDFGYCSSLTVTAVYLSGFRLTFIEFR